MAYSLNRAQLIGNLTSDPEVRQIPNGRTVASFSVATNSSWTDSNGQKQDKAEFHNIVCWGKLAEIIGQFLKKGRKIYVEGRLQTRNWEGEDGVKRYRTEIVADNIIMLDKAGDSPMGGTPLSTTPRQVSEPTPTQSAPIPQSTSDSPTPAIAAEEEVTIDDLPF